MNRSNQEVWHAVWLMLFPLFWNQHYIHFYEQKTAVRSLSCQAVQLHLYKRYLLFK